MKVLVLLFVLHFSIVSFSNPSREKENIYGNRPVPTWTEYVNALEQFALALVNLNVDSVNDNELSLVSFCEDLNMDTSSFKSEITTIVRYSTADSLNPALIPGFFGATTDTNFIKLVKNDLKTIVTYLNNRFNSLRATQPLGICKDLLIACAKKCSRWLDYGVLAWMAFYCSTICVDDYAKCKGIEPIFGWF